MTRSFLPPLSCTDSLLPGDWAQPSAYSSFHFQAGLETVASRKYAWGQGKGVGKRQEFGLLTGRPAPSPLFSLSFPGLKDPANQKAPTGNKAPFESLCLPGAACRQGLPWPLCTFASQAQAGPEEQPKLPDTPPLTPSRGPTVHKHTCPEPLGCWK